MIKGERIEIDLGQFEDPEGRDTLLNVVMREAIFFMEVDYNKNALIIDLNDEIENGDSFIGNHKITLELIELVEGN